MLAGGKRSLKPWFGTCMGLALPDCQTTWCVTSAVVELGVAASLRLLVVSGS